MTFFFLLYLLLCQLIIRGQIDGVQHSTTRCFIYILDELGIGSRRYIILYINKIGISVGSHSYIYIYAILRITGNQSIACSIYRTIERQVKRFFCIHHQHIIYVKLKTIFQILEVFIVQVTVCVSLVALRVENAVIMESQPVRLYENTVFYEESGVQYVYFHGSIAKYASFHGKPFKFTIEMYVATGSSVKFRCNTTHVVFNKLEIGAVRFNL